MVSQESTVRSEARVPTSSAERYTQQLCSHAAGKTPRAEWTPPEVVIEFPDGMGTCRLTAESDRLVLMVEATDRANLARVQEIVGGSSNDSPAGKTSRWSGHRSTRSVPACQAGSSSRGPYLCQRLDTRVSRALNRTATGGVSFWKRAATLTDTLCRYTFLGLVIDGRNAVNPAARVMARVLTACAVLVGLAFMHSLGAAIGTGCAGGTSSMATSVALPAATGGHAAVTAEGATTAMSDPVLLAAPPHPAGHGTVCVSTPPRGDAAGSAALAATGLTEPAALEQPSLGILREGGAVPRAGPVLLISLCVSRT